MSDSASPPLLKRGRGFSSGATGVLRSEGEGPEPASASARARPHTHAQTHTHTHDGDGPRKAPREERSDGPRRQIAPDDDGDLMADERPRTRERPREEDRAGARAHTHTHTHAPTRPGEARGEERAQRSPPRRDDRDRERDGARGRYLDERRERSRSPRGPRAHTHTHTRRDDDRDAPRASSDRSAPDPSPAASSRAWRAAVDEYDRARVRALDAERLGGSESMGEANGAPGSGGVSCVCVAVYAPPRSAVASLSTTAFLDDVRSGVCASLRGVPECVSACVRDAAALRLGAEDAEDAKAWMSEHPVVHVRVADSAEIAALGLASSQKRVAIVYVRTHALVDVCVSPHTAVHNDTRISGCPASFLRYTAVEPRGAKPDASTARSGPSDAVLRAFIPAQSLGPAHATSNGAIALSNIKKNAALISSGISATSGVVTDGMLAALRARASAMAPAAAPPPAPAQPSAFLPSTTPADIPAPFIPLPSKRSGAAPDESSAAPAPAPQLPFASTAAAMYKHPGQNPPPLVNVTPAVAAAARELSTGDALPPLPPSAPPLPTSEAAPAPPVPPPADAPAAPSAASSAAFQTALRTALVSGGSAVAIHSIAAALSGGTASVQDSLEAAAEAATAAAETAAASGAPLLGMQSSLTSVAFPNNVGGGSVNLGATPASAAGLLGPQGLMAMLAAITPTRVLALLNVVTDAIVRDDAELLDVIADLAIEANAAATSVAGSVLSIRVPQPQSAKESVDVEFARPIRVPVYAATMGGIALLEDRRAPDRSRVMAQDKVLFFERALGKHGEHIGLLTDGPTAASGLSAAGIGGNSFGAAGASYAMLTDAPSDGGGDAGGASAASSAMKDAIIGGAGSGEGDDGAGYDPLVGRTRGLGRVFIECNSIAAAVAIQNELSGRSFDGRIIITQFVNEARYSAGEVCDFRACLPLPVRAQ